MSPWENFPIAVGWVKRFLTALAFLSGVHSYFSRVCIRISVTRVFVRICVGQKISSRPFKYFLNEFAFQVKQPRQICSDARSNICRVHFTLKTSRARTSRGTTNSPIVHERSDPAVVSCVSFPHERSDTVPAENMVATF